MSLKPNLLWWWRWNDRTQNMLVKEHKLCVPLTLLSTIILSSTAVCLDPPVVWIIYWKKKKAKSEFKQYSDELILKELKFN